VALRVGQRCTRSFLPLLYPNGSHGKATERRAFSSKHEDGWQWGSNRSTALAALCKFPLL